MKKKIPTGIQEFKKLRDKDYYTIDKSMMIQEFLEIGSEVTLLTRPRRFGKSLNMSMMAEFFDITKDSTSLFQGLKIMDSEYACEMNQYPTIFISFAQCKGDFELMKLNLFDTLYNEFERYEAEFTNEKVSANLLYQVKENFEILLKRKNFTEIYSSIRMLSKLLYTVYGKKVMIFIDEYDTPFIEAHVKGYYDKIHDVVVSILQSSLKGNPYLEYAMLTGIQRVAKENVFSGLNNVDVFSVEDSEYSECFGFTTNETKTILEAYGLELNDDVKQMYDGYKCGGTELYNPWSIINYAKRRVLNTYWVDTSANSMIKKACT